MIESILDILILKFIWKNKTRRLIFGALFMILAIIGFFISTNNRERRPYWLTIEKSKQTINELNLYYSSFKKYPANLVEIISNNPLKRNSVVDGWNRTFFIY